MTDKKIKVLVDDFPVGVLTNFQPSTKVVSPIYTLPEITTSDATPLKCTVPVTKVVMSADFARLAGLMPEPPEKPNRAQRRKRRA